MPLDLIAQFHDDDAAGLLPHSPGPEMVDTTRPATQVLNDLSYQAAAMALERQAAAPLVGDVPEEIQTEVRSRVPIGLGLGINI